jgi:hypothetical protein
MASSRNVSSGYRRQISVPIRHEAALPPDEPHEGFEMSPRVILKTPLRSFVGRSVGRSVGGWVGGVFSKPSDLRERDRQQEGPTG